MGWGSQYTSHSAACVVHAVSLGVLAGLAAREQPLCEYARQFWYSPSLTGVIEEPRVWYYTCDDGAVGDVAECPDSAKRFRVTPPADAVTVNPIFLASLYVGVSALNHGAVWAVSNIPSVTDADLDTVATRCRWADYAITAPTMLAVLALVYGSESITAVVTMPVVLAVLLLVGAVCERAPSERAIALSSRKGLVILALYPLYALALAPAIASAYAITEEAEPTAKIGGEVLGVGTAPDFVFAFTVFTAVTFSSFGVLYAIDGFVWPITDASRRERYYTSLSMIAKVTLHLFLGLSIIGTGTSVGVGADDDTGDSDMGDLAIGLGGAAATVVVVIVANWIGFHERPVRSGATPSTLSIRLIDMAS